MRKKKVTSIYLDPEQAEALAKLSERTHAPQAYYIREAIRLFLATQEKPKARGT